MLSHDAVETTRTTVPPIHIYAEHLSHIKTLSIKATLATNSNASTSAKVTGEEDVLEIVHDGQHATLKLPVHVETGSVPLQTTSTPSTILSFRFKLRDNNLAPPLPNIVPWTASTLQSSTEISCATCRLAIVTRDKIHHWKDLPSEGWAEMMDFWHCHKPEEPEDHKRQTSRKGYSAASRLLIETGVGLAGITTITLSPYDVQNIKVMPSKDSLVCVSCQAFLGTIESDSSAYRLNKSSLAFSICSTEASRVLETSAWLACSVLAAMENQGLRKFNVICSKHDKPGIHAWIFAPDLLVSTSNSINGEPFRVMKLMYKHILLEDALRNDEILNNQVAATGLLDLSVDDLALLQQHLEHSQVLLPADLRQFGDWQVGLLPRFTTLYT